MQSLLVMFLVVIGLATSFVPLRSYKRQSLINLQASSRQPPVQALATPPLLLRAARGEKVERPPVWMMRQAGRHIAEYRELVKKHPTFRERSEVPELAVEISLQPWRNYKTDGCILFSDILTPLPGLGLDFDIQEKKGPVMTPVRTWDAVNKMHLIDPFATCPFVDSALRTLRSEVTPETTVLGFVGCPYTLATYLVEGGSSTNYFEIKKVSERCAIKLTNGSP